jgi:hypothetical protein
LDRLKAAKEYAEWSRKDREARVPKLTPDQRTQMREYLAIVQHHGLNQGFADSSKDAEDFSRCPVMQREEKRNAAARMPKE